MFKKLLFGCFVAVLMAGCIKDTNDGCAFDPCEVKAPASEIQSVQSYLSSNNITAQQHCSGLFYKVVDTGTGKKPDACTYVKVNYVGSLTNGTVFEQGPYSTYLDGVIRAWTIGVPLIREGGRIHLFIPPSLAYGSKSAGPIPANSILIFDIELVTVY